MGADCHTAQTERADRRDSRCYDKKSGNVLSVVQYSCATHQLCGHVLTAVERPCTVDTEHSAQVAFLQVTVVPGDADSVSTRASVITGMS